MASRMLALALVGLFLAGPPVLPPEDAGPPSSEPAPIEPAPIEPAPIEPAPIEPAPIEPIPIEDQPITVTPPEPGSVEPAPTPPVQRPGATPPIAPAPIVDPSAAPPEPAVEPAVEPEPEPEAEPEAEPESEPKKEPRKLGGVRLFRFGFGAKLGYTHGTSQKDGLYDRDKSIQDSIDNGMVTMSGAGDLGNTKFAGFQGGFVADIELVGINVWLDFHKFFNPGGMWSLLLGYDHEFGLGKQQRLRLDPALAFGVHKVFLGSALSELYYDPDNPESVNIGTLGIEARAMLDLHIKLVGPLFTGPGLMLGYHYLWSANAAEVTTEKGLHYSIGWSLRVDFATPKLLGNQGRKREK